MKNIFKRNLKLYRFAIIATVFLCGMYFMSSSTLAAVSSFDPLETACSGSGAGSEACVGKVAENPVSAKILAVSELVSYAVGIAAVLMIMVNGIRYGLSGGDSNKVNSSKNGIIFALVGSVVVFSARAIIALVISGIS